MSLKAYDGMMTTKGLSYVQEKVKENIPKFKEAATKRIIEAYVDCIISCVDNYHNPKTLMELFKAGDKVAKQQINEIPVNETTTLVTYLQRCAEILAFTKTANDFYVSLPITIEQKGRKLLMFPFIWVPEYREILLSFLTDWYAQNQTDPPEDIPKKEWKQRCKDWWGFGEIPGMKTRIMILDEYDFFSHPVRFLKNEELIKQIINALPSDETRTNAIQKQKFLTKHMKDNTTEPDNNRKYFDAIDFYRTEEGKIAFEKFKTENPIKLVAITEEYLTTVKVNDFVIKK